MSATGDRARAARAVGVACAALLALAAGCSTTPRSPGAEEEPSLPEGLISARASRLEIAVAGLGALPYDGFALPLLSPDARFAATETGDPPSWPTILAEAGAEPPAETLLAIYEIDAGSAPRRRAAVEVPAVLGRSADEMGFLVEAPQPDGARWIGRARWTDGRIDWLVQDDHVNAFAVLGPNGALAWSRRAVDANEFELVVRAPAPAAVPDASGAAPEAAQQTDGPAPDAPDATDATDAADAADDAGGMTSAVGAETLPPRPTFVEWTLPPRVAGSWLLPTFSPDGQTLFALELRDGVLQLTALSLHSEAAMRQPVEFTTLSTRGTATMAFQTLAPQHGALAGPGQPPESLLLFHPAHRRMALWNARDHRMLSLPPKSLAATFVEADQMVIAFEKAVVLQPLRPGEPPEQLMEGTFVPRSVDNERHPLVLLAPERGMVNLVGVRLLTAERRTARAPAAPPAAVGWVPP